MKELDYLKEIKELIEFVSEKGTFFLLRNNARYRQLFPDEDGYLIFFRNNKKYKLKASKVAYELGNNSIVSKDHVILHRNLDFEDYRLVNLRKITKNQFTLIKEAHKNLNGALKLLPHHQDVFSYVLHWRENGKDKSQVIQDIVPARKQLVRLQLKYAKILSTYCLFDI